MQGIFVCCSANSMFSSLFNLDSDWVLFVFKDIGLQQKVAADQIRPVYGSYRLL